MENVSSLNPIASCNPPIPKLPPAIPTSVVFPLWKANPIPSAPFGLDPRFTWPVNVKLLFISILLVNEKLPTWLFWSGVIVTIPVLASYVADPFNLKYSRKLSLSTWAKAASSDASALLRSCSNNVLYDTFVWAEFFLTLVEVARTALPVVVAVNDWAWLLTLLVFWLLALVVSVFTALLLLALVESAFVALLLLAPVVSAFAALLLLALVESAFVALLLLAPVVSAFAALLLLALLAAVAADWAALFVSLVLFTVAAVKFPEVVSAWTSTVDTPPKTKKDSVAIAAKTNFLPSLYIL